MVAAIIVAAAIAPAGEAALEIMVQAQRSLAQRENGKWVYPELDLAYSYHDGEKARLFRVSEGSPREFGTFHLAANIYLPEDPGRVPAILQYTPYMKDGQGGRGNVEVGQLTFARRGYAAVTLDLRGFGASEGDAAPPFSTSEALDGHDALEWLAAFARSEAGREAAE